jgi:hypothetical protein
VERVVARVDADGRRLASVLTCLGCGQRFATGRAIYAHFPDCGLGLWRDLRQLGAPASRLVVQRMAEDGPVVMPPDDSPMTPEEGGVIRGALARR